VVFDSKAFKTTAGPGTRQKFLQIQENDENEKRRKNKKMKHRKAELADHSHVGGISGPT